MYFPSLVLLKKVALYIVFAYIICLPDLYSQIQGEYQNPMTTAIEFTENVGQFTDVNGIVPEEVLFVTNINGIKIYVRKQGLSFVFHQGDDNVKSKQQDFGLTRPVKPIKKSVKLCRTDLDFIGANPNPRIFKTDELSAYNNYIIGDKEFYFVKNYGNVILKDVYKGIDLVLYENPDGRFEYDFVVLPGTSPSVIKMRIKNAINSGITSDGLLTITNLFGSFEQPKPIIYQNENNKRIKYDGNFIELNDGTIGFDIGSYDRSKPLIIDPVVRLWGSNFGGDGNEFAHGLAIDSLGNSYMVGQTYSTNLIVNTQQIEYTGNGDAFIAKYDKNGKRIWSTYYGGSSTDEARSIAVDLEQGIYVLGSSLSKDINGTINQMYPRGNIDAFILRLNPNGTQKWMTFYGGGEDDTGYGIVVDSLKNCYATGYALSTNLKTTSNKYRGSQSESFVLKLTPEGNTVWAIYLGGDGHDWTRGITLDKSLNVLVCGGTTSYFYPAALSYSSQKGYTDGFIAKLTNNGELLWSVYYGGDSVDVINAVAVDKNDFIVAGGNTLSQHLRVNYGVDTLMGEQDAFVLKLKPDGFYLWARYFGGNKTENCGSIVFDKSGKIYIGGSTDSKDLPTNFLYKTSLGSPDIFISKYLTDGITDWASYLGGKLQEKFGCMVIDNLDNLHVTGWTEYDSLTGGLNTEHIYDPNETAFLYKIGQQIILNYDAKYLCKGTEINVPFIPQLIFKETNVFTIQLSDEYGNFNSPKILGSLNTNQPGIIIGKIPEILPDGLQYRIRIVSSDNIISNDNGNGLSVAFPPKFDFTGDTASCENNMSSFATPDKQKILYHWSVTGGKISGRNDTSFVAVIFDSTGTQSVTLIESDKNTGCTKSITKNISIIANPKISTDTLPTICQKDGPITLQFASPAGGSYFGIGVQNGIFDPTVANDGIHTITYSYTNSYGCSSTTSQNIKVNPNPVKPSILQIDQYLESTENSIKYEWYFNDTLMINSTTKRIYAEKTGKYTLQITNLFGCKSEISDIYNFISGVNDIDIQYKVSIYPNPTEGLLQIYIIGIQGRLIDLKITDLLGKEILANEFRINSENWNEKIDLSLLSKGMYILHISIDKDFYVEKIIVK
ncbi:MAG: hypothetical protein HW421_3059 [Ignavibacteria bacterium]|nr:hypothetical protein [Ignavibacteria bacterium]